MEVFNLWHTIYITRDVIHNPIFKTIYTYGLLPFIRLKIYISGSFYDQCIAKNGLHYIRDGGEDGCYYFHSLSFSMEYDYNKSKEFCENISDANGSLPIVKGPKDNNNMLHLLNGYVGSLYHDRFFNRLHILKKMSLYVIVFIEQAVFLGAEASDLSGSRTRFEWNDGTELSYTQYYGDVAPSSCLVVRGNTRHSIGTSENKLWNSVSCDTRLSAVICHLSFREF